MTREEAMFYIRELERLYASMDKKVAEAVDMAIEALSVDLVRCGECKHDLYCCRNIRPEGRLPDDFCSFGEMRSDAVQGFRGGKIPPKELLDGNVLIPKHQWIEMERELAELKEKFASAEAEPTVIRSRTLMPTKDFKEWAKRIREENPNVIVIPCDAEVVSAEAEWIPVTERLPECNGRYLVTNEAWGAYEIEINVWKHGEWYYNTKPIAWMELPPAYKEETDE